jgi:Aspartyl protease
LVPRLSIYMVDVFLGGRGPVKMLVDSGASDSFLNWKGVSDLSLTRDSNFLTRLSAPMGAVGSDAVAMELTHRIGISSNLNFGKCDQIGLPLKDSKRLSIDIGNIAILDAVRGVGVGGILGIDAFMRCDCVRMSFHSNRLIQFLVDKKAMNS